MKTILILCFVASILLQGDDGAPASGGYSRIVFGNPRQTIGSDGGSDEESFGGNGGEKYILVEINRR